MIPIGRFIAEGSCLVPVTWSQRTVPPIRSFHFILGLGTEAIFHFKNSMSPGFWGTKKRFWFNFIDGLPKAEKSSK
jgi:hypothetical protein